MSDIELIKQLREETLVSLGECKKALEEAGGDIEEAKRVLLERNKDIAIKKGSRNAGDGLIHAYIHMNGKTGVMVNLGCETDFVSKSEDFEKLAHDICLQIVAMNPEDIDGLMEQQWVKDSNKTIKDLIEEHIGKVGENIVLRNFVKYEI